MVRRIAQILQRVRLSSRIRLDISVTTDTEGTTGTVQHRVEAKGIVNTALFDGDGRRVAETSGTSVKVVVVNAGLCAPGAPYLNKLRITLSDSLNEYSLPFGIWKISVGNLQVLILPMSHQRAILL